MTQLKNIDRNDYKPLYAQLGDNLIDYIETNGLKPGDLIPSENELIRYYGVSSLTVRIAMQRLATEGIINRIQGKGTFVADRKVKDQIKGVQSLEKRLADQGIQVKNVFLEAYLAHPTRRYIKELNLPEGNQTLKVRRLKKIDDIVMGIETRQIPQEIADIFTTEELKTEPFVELLNRNPETRVYRISYRTRSALVLEMEADMMGVSPDTPVLVQNSVFYNRMDKPLMAGRITYLSDKLELEYVVQKDNDYSEKVLI